MGVLWETKRNFIYLILNILIFCLEFGIGYVEMGKFSLKFIFIEWGIHWRLSISSAFYPVVQTRHYYCYSLNGMWTRASIRRTAWKHITSIVIHKRHFDVLENCLLNNHGILSEIVGTGEATDRNIFTYPHPYSYS